MYSSNAKWSDIDPTKDTHQTWAQANAVCVMLINDYGEHGRGCPDRGFCLDAWVEKEPDEKSTQ